MIHRRSTKTLLLFLLGFGVHAAGFLALETRLDLPLSDTALRLVATAGLLIAVAAVWRDLAGRDEVERRLALIACGVSFTLTALLAYLGPLWDAAPFDPPYSLWSIAMLVWIACYGFLQWRARW